MPHKSRTSPLFGHFLAEDTYHHFGDEANTYMGIGRVISFGTGAGNVEDVIFTTNYTNELWKNMVGMKKIEEADMQVVIARRDWATNTVYDQYEDHIEIFSYEQKTSIGTANANANTTLTGTANIVASNVVVGNGTSFLSYIFPGDQIAVNLATKTVVSVTNNQHLIVNSAFANTNTDGSIVLIANSKTLVANSVDFSTLSDGDVIIIEHDTAKEVVSVRSNKVISINSAFEHSESNVEIIIESNTFPLYANNFYVRNTRDQVFKCLYNNESANSTVEPTIDIDGQLPENPFILTSDGYKWKYMYTIAPGLKQKFFTDTWMPVITDPTVEAAAVSGRVDIIEVDWGGSGYLNGGNSNTANILSITATDGSGASLLARVSNGVITSVTILDGGSEYTRGTVTVTDPSRLGNLILGGTVNVSGTVVSGNLSNTTYFVGNTYPNDLITINGQTRNVVSVINNTSLTVNTAFTGTINSAVAIIGRSDAQFDIDFAPHTGHGSNPPEELGCRSLMITMELDGDENDTIPVSDGVNTFDFNQVSIVIDPLVANGASVADGANYRTSDKVFVSEPGITNFTDDETVYVGSSLTSATMVANVAHWDGGDNYLYINNITGDYVPGEII